MSSPIEKQQLQTVHIVPLTAFDQNDQINVDVQASHTAKLYEAGMRVFLPGAGTSEFHSLLPEEIVELVKITRESTGPDALIFAPIGYQVGIACQTAIDSMKAGATGIMFMPFAHPYMSDRGAEEYYLSVMDAADCPTLYYKKSDIPSDALLLKLGADKRSIGVKYSVNQMHQFRTTVTADEHGLEWICGSAERFAPYYMLAGSGGFTSGAGNICPHLSLAMHVAFAAGDYAEGMRIQQLILPIEDYRARAGDSFNISMLKYAITLKGADFGPPRPPQRTLTSEQETEIRQLMEPVLQAEAKLAQQKSPVS
ncbi:MAG: dihydrodipicolinate synthase family protein [Planctomycetes bacterium]|nr:dihydrodipicolinate synthase family protein [Planctomycetota bacterium]MCH9777369.1 dihydrodipicolinate synthase family protein [Planctomycetota bacterium]MCH9793485.1 dihydrodipicolinate synthase family protein [Planctomycetota bacterium]MDF1745118.1 dihydrodipicolinate synthase family protein [Gimesia sp.]